MKLSNFAQNGEVVSAFHMAMKSLIQARRECGKDDLLTARFIVIVADVTKQREKYYLAERLYRKVLSIQERAFGPTNPDVVRSKLALIDLKEHHGR